MAGRTAVESFVPHLAGRRVLLPKDYQAVCSVLARLTSRSLERLAELRRLWYLLESNGIQVKARYIQSAANVLADCLSRHIFRQRRLAAERRALRGARGRVRVPIRRPLRVGLKSDATPLQRGVFGPGLRGGGLFTRPMRVGGAENNYRAPLLPLLTNLVQKLRQSGAAATVIVAPRLEGKMWHQAIAEMAVAERVVPPSPEIYMPGRISGLGMLGAPRWAVTVFRVPS
eukprot:jgi/Tetstr1/428430/TSEL_018444.t1